MKETDIAFLLLILGGAIALCGLAWLWMRYQDRQELKWYARCQMLERGMFADPEMTRLFNESIKAAEDLKKHFEEK